VGNAPLADDRLVGRPESIEAQKDAPQSLRREARIKELEMRLDVPVKDQRVLLELLGDRDHTSALSSHRSATLRARKALSIRTITLGASLALENRSESAGELAGRGGAVALRTAG
jgi:hypothetical protein